LKYYETTIVIDSLQKAEEIQETITKIQTFIKNNGGEIVKLDEWGKKRLAYEINRKQYGNYVQIIFTGPGTIPKLLERELVLEESVLRYLTLALKPKVAAMKTASEEEEPAEAAPAKTAAPAEAAPAQTAAAAEAAPAEPEAPAEADGAEPDAATDPAEPVTPAVEEPAGESEQPDAEKAAEETSS